MKQEIQVKRYTLNEHARRNGLGEGVTITKGTEVLEFRERRGHVTLRRGKEDPKPERIKKRDAVIRLSQSLAKGWRVERTYVDELGH